MICARLKRQEIAPGFNRGFSMIEVLVTIVILSFGLLGVAGLIVTGLKNSHSAALRNEATVVAYDIIDRIRANRDAALASDYDLAKTNGGTAITGSTVSAIDQNAWLARIGTSLPSGTGAISVANRMVTITVTWNDRRGSGESSDTKTFVTQTQL